MTPVLSHPTVKSWDNGKDVCELVRYMGPSGKAFNTQPTTLGSQEDSWEGREDHPLLRRVPHNPLDLPDVPAVDGVYQTEGEPYGVDLSSRLPSSRVYL